MKRRELAYFTLISLAFCALVFGRGMLGREILAPVDIAPALWAQYRYVDPDSNSIPQNHHIVDQLSYDLPLQWTIYHAYREGEIPWWDPYTYGGRPFLADAHINGTDPLRILCYLAIPDFVLAYNWTRVLQSVVTGLGFYYLLRQLGFEPRLAGPLALTGQFAGCTSIYFGHPWIGGAFAYYPWLWAMWHRAFGSSVRWPWIAASVLVASAIAAGNLQSHAYLPLFALAFVAGYGGRTPDSWRKAIGVVAFTGVLGGLLAAPVLLPEMELFLRNERLTVNSPQIFRSIDGPLALSAFYPWTLGTFRTVGYVSLGFNAFIGTAGFVLAFFGLRAPLQSEPASAMARRCGAFLAGLFFLILSVPPLQRMLYTRCAGLAVLGLIVLAAFGLRELLNSAQAWRKTAWALGAIAMMIAVVSHVGVWVLYPRVRERLDARMAAHTDEDGYEGRSAQLRAFQVANLPHEITFRNPEVLAAWLSLVALAAVCGWPTWRRRGGVLLGLNLLPLLLFAMRFVPHGSIIQWERLLAGSEEQQRVLAALLPEKRLRERVAEFSRLFPMDIAHLYRLHVVHGYAALQPRAQIWYPDADEKVSDYLYEGGKLRKITAAGNARFSWVGQPEEPVQVTGESLNRIALSFPGRKGGTLLRTDTYFPGWSALTPEGMTVPITEDGIFSRIEIPPGVSQLELRYRPTGWRAGQVCAALGVLSLAAVSLLGRGTLSSTKAVL